MFLCLRIKHHFVILFLLFYCLILDSSYISFVFLKLMSSFVSFQRSYWFHLSFLFFILFSFVGFGFVSSFYILVYFNIFPFIFLFMLLFYFKFLFSFFYFHLFAIDLLYLFEFFFLWGIMVLVFIFLYFLFCLDFSFSILFLFCNIFMVFD